MGSQPRPHGIHASLPTFVQFESKHVARVLGSKIQMMKAGKQKVVTWQFSNKVDCCKLTEALLF
jgi:hypothetical protein